jgi:hypothetical protein
VLIRVSQYRRDEEERFGELTAGRGNQLLEALGISMADLTLRAMAPDEDTRISLIGSVSAIMRATGNDVEKRQATRGRDQRVPGPD